MIRSIVVGTTEPYDFQLMDRAVGQPVLPLDGSGLSAPTLEIFKENSDGSFTQIVPPPTVTWIDSSLGKVRVTGLEILAKGDYRVRFKLVDGSGGIGFIPNGEDADLWRVRPVEFREI